MLLTMKSIDVWSKTYSRCKQAADSVKARNTESCKENLLNASKEGNGKCRGSDRKAYGARIRLLNQFPPVCHCKT